MGGTRHPRNDSGAAFVEFVIVVPIFLTMTFAMIGFGMLFSLRQTLSQAATEGARAAAIAPFGTDSAGRTSRATTSINDAFSGDASCGSGLTCSVVMTPASCTVATTECTVAVTLTYTNISNRIPVPQGLGLGLPNSLTYKASARIK